MKIRATGNTTLLVLLGAALVSTIAYLGLVASPFGSVPKVDMRTEPAQVMLNVGDTTSIDIVVESDIPVNVFAGNVHFDPRVLKVASIDYNLSIADLWAELPWYSNGDGVVNFAGGTTKPGGFTGTGSLLTITFKTLAAGNGDITIDDARILLHDGLGTDATLEQPIDTIITIAEPNITHEVLYKEGGGTDLLVLPEPPATDLNNDGKQSIADLSIFMMHLASGNKRSDFNKDGKVTVSDLSILLEAE